MRRELPQHVRYRLRLEATPNGEEPVTLVGPVASGFLRIVTNRRDFARFPGLRWRHPLEE